MALRNDPGPRKVLGRRSAATSSTASRPLWWACSSSRLSGAGVPATPGRVVPRASARQAMVEAVPMVLQWPRLRIIADSDSRKVSRASLPARTSSPRRHTSVPQPSGVPRKWPVSIGPPGTTRAGRSTEAAAMSRAGIVLSQPPSSTAPSTGLARSSSSAAMAARLRQSMAVGRTWVSPSDTTGRLSGTPPASQTPSLTLAATSSRWLLQGARSEAVLAMAMCGRPSKAWRGSPRRIHARCT